MITGTIWKLGCHWGKGKPPSFYNFIRNKEIVIGVEEQKYSIGDLVVITEGYNVKAIARVKEAPQSVLSDESLEQPFEEYKIDYEDWVNYTEAEWYELHINDQFQYQLQQGIRKVQNVEIRNKIIELWNNRNHIHKSITNNMNLALNIILYGPPGTGKTYNSIDKAVEIAAPELYIQEGEDKHRKNKELFDELRKQGQVEFVTFHQNYTYENFVIGIAPDVTSGQLRFDKREGIFKQLADKAKQNWLSATQEKETSFDFNIVFNKFFAELIQEEVKEVDIPMKTKGYKFKITSIDPEDGRIKFTKQSGGTGHDLLIKNLKAIYEGSLDYGFQGLGVYYYPLVEKLNYISQKHYQGYYF